MLLLRWNLLGLLRNDASAVAAEPFFPPYSSSRSSSFFLGEFSVLRVAASTGKAKSVVKGSCLRWKTCDLEEGASDH